MARSDVNGDAKPNMRWAESRSRRRLRSQPERQVRQRLSDVRSGRRGPGTTFFSYLFRQIKVEMATRETTCSAAPSKMYSMQLFIQSRYAGYTKRRAATEMTVIVHNETFGICTLYPPHTHLSNQKENPRTIR